MRGPKPPEVHLDEMVRHELEKLVRGHGTAQQIALRGRLIVRAAAGLNNSEIARREGVEIDTVRLWRQRWLSLEAIALADLSVAARLQDAPRPGRPAAITAEQVCHLIEMACEAPEKSGRPISQWTGRELADELKQRGIVEQISPRHAARLLKKTTCSRT